MYKWSVYLTDGRIVDIVADSVDVSDSIAVGTTLLSPFWVFENKNGSVARFRNDVIIGYTVEPYEDSE